MHVHLATIGEKEEPIRNVIKTVPRIDVIYLLYTDGVKDVADNLYDHYKEDYEVHLERIDLSDFMEIVQKIWGIARRYEIGTKFTINITGGTKLISAAAYYSSYYIRAEPWYSQYITKDGVPVSDKCKVFPIKAPMAVDISSYSDLTKDILRYIYEREQEAMHEPITNMDIADRFDKSKQTIGHHIHILLEDKLIDIKKVGRENNISLTEHGVMMARYATHDDVVKTNSKK